jgi:hypothetical protein
MMRYLLIPLLLAVAVIMTMSLLATPPPEGRKTPTAARTK